MPKKRSIINFAGFGNDVKEARRELGLSRKALAGMAGINPRYLANIEIRGDLPSLPIFYELVKACRLSVEQYFHPDIQGQGSPERRRAANKLNLCPEQYLPIVEATLDGIIRMDEAGKPRS